MKKLGFLLTILLLLACSENKPKTLKEMESDKLLSESFTENELEDLSKIVEFFESQICLDEGKSKDECYFEFNKSTIEDFSQKGIDYKVPINYKLQEELYSEIDTIFFKEIWVHPKFFIGKDFKTEIIEEAYNLNLFGKYILFLKSLKNEDVLFRDFYKIFNSVNEISFGVQAYAFNQFELKEFKGIKRRLFFAIYYLTVNDKMHNYKSRKP